MAQYRVRAYGPGWFDVVLEAKDEEEAEKKFYDGECGEIINWWIDYDGIGEIDELNASEQGLVDKE